MPGESQLTPSSSPDPSVLTTEQMLRAVGEVEKLSDARLDVIRQRLDDADKATELLSTQVNRVPTQLDEAIAHLRSLHDGRFDSVALQFAERDTRSERESRDNKVAVDAAFAAQKEAAQKQDESNAKAIDKSEAATNEAIKKLDALFTTKTDALGAKIDDVKSDLSETKQLVNGNSQNRAGGTEALARLVTVGVLVLAAAGVAISLIVK